MSEATRFIVDFFGRRSTSPVCIVSFANDRSEANKFPPKEIYTRDGDEIEQFVARWDQPGRAIYFCVATIAEGKRRSKENVDEVLCLHSDLDYKGIAQSPAEIDEVVAALAKPASKLVRSGHGLHGYWWFKTASKDRVRVENALRRLAWALAGDPQVCEVARVMRLPGSHNTKFGEWTAVEVVGGKGKLYSLDELEAWLNAIENPLLRRRGKDDTTTAIDPFKRVAREQMRSERIDLDAMWEELEYYGPGGGGNLHDTQVRIGAALLSRGEPADNVVAYLQEQIKQRVPESNEPGWKWDAEVKDIRDQCIAWFAKHPDVLALQEQMPKWVRRDRRIQRLLEDASDEDSGFEGVKLKTEQKQQEEPPVFDALFAEELEARGAPKDLMWIVKDFVLAGALNGLFGDGGVGKDLLLMQLGIAMSCGAKWLGREVRRGKVLYFPVEDDVDELRRRQFNINNHFRIKAADYPGQFKIVPLLGKDTILSVWDSKAGVVKPTLLFESVRRLIAEFKPTLTIVGNRVNIFSVNQNDDAQARQCIGLLNSLCTEFGTAIIMPSHVSLGGAQSGEGTSGSVQWNNGIRLRMYLRRIKGDKDDPEPNPNQRELEVMKSNYSAKGEMVSVVWQDGVFKPDGLNVVPPQPQEGETEEQAKRRRQDDNKLAAEVEFIKMLRDALKMGQRLSAQPKARNNAPTVFSENSSCKHRGKIGRKVLSDAMERLFRKGTIATEQYGPKSNDTHRVVLTSDNVVPFKTQKP